MLWDLSSEFQTIKTLMELSGSPLKRSDPEPAQPVQVLPVEFNSPTHYLTLETLFHVFPSIAIIIS
jgi:hypothetical protein